MLNTLQLDGLHSSDLGNRNSAQHEHQKSASSGQAPHNRSRFLAGLAGLGLLGAGTATWVYASQTAAVVSPVEVPPPSVTIALPSQEQVANRIELTGQFSAVNQVTLSAQVSGYLTAIHFKDGQLVHKGDLLFEIDPRPFEIQLQQATAQYQTATAALELADKQVTRTTRLNRDQFASDESLDQRTQTQRAAAAAVRAAEASMRSAQLNLEFTKIIAPFSGRMGMRQVSIGSLINGGTNSSGQTALASVVSLDPIYLDFDMSEANYISYEHALGHRAAGRETQVKISLDGEEQWQRSGLLDFLDNKIDRGSGTMHARATLDNPDLSIAPGQFARVRMPVSEVVPKLLVPDASILTDQSTKMVMVVGADGIANPKRVEVGALENDGMRVITKGLEPTDRVIVNGLMQAGQGQKVQAHFGTLAASEN